MITAQPALDGRTARAQRTRDAVVDALLALIEDGHLQPTARQVAERAQVSLRSVFQHFADLESLFAAAADRQIARFSHSASRVDPAAPLAGRILTFVANRAELLEGISPVRRSAVLQEPFSKEIARRLKWARETSRAELARAFAPELERLPAARRKAIMDALDIAADWPAWDALRRQRSLSVYEARQVITITLQALLKEDTA